MFKKLLIAIDGLRAAGKALAAGLELGRIHGPTVLVLTATDPVSPRHGCGGFGTLSAGTILERLEESYAAQASLVLDAARSEADRAGLTVETLHVPRQRPPTRSSRRPRPGEPTPSSWARMATGASARLILGSQAAEVLARFRSAGC